MPILVFSRFAPASWRDLRQARRAVNLLSAFFISSLAGLIRPDRTFHAPHLLGHISDGLP